MIEKMTLLYSKLHNLLNKMYSQLKIYENKISKIKENLKFQFNIKSHNNLPKIKFREN